MRRWLHRPLWRWSNTSSARACHRPAPGSPRGRPSSGKDYFGRTVNLAARIADYARPREVVVNVEVAELSAHAARFREIGPVLLKGMEEPVTLLTAFSATN